MNGHSYIACDLGAESGRVMLGTLEEGKLTLEEVHRFPTGPLPLFGTLRWNIPNIYAELLAGLKKVAARQLRIASVSVDSWGVDYVLLREGEPMLGLPWHYRDARTDAVYEQAIQHATPEVIYHHTGIQFMPLNTLYQLLAERDRQPSLLGLAGAFLGIGDYFNYLLSGQARAEESLASTTQLYDPRARAWATELIHLFELPRDIFPEIVPSGTVLGPLLHDVQSATSLGHLEVIATCSHDTGAAVAAVPARGHDWAYLSSGTWSLIGVELQLPLIDTAAMVAGFTNEAGCGGTTRFLKNLVGLWILQECRRAWTAAGDEHTYDELMRLADAAEPFRSLIDPGAAPFQKPGDMPEKIAAYCERTDQPVPRDVGEFTRCILESLALLYRRALDDLHAATGRTIRELHIVGGGSSSRLLNQFTASALERNVHAGPVEATAIGNVLLQALALGHLESHEELRRVVAASFPVETYHPLATRSWEGAYARFAKLLPA